LRAMPTSPGQAAAPSIPSLSRRFTAIGEWTALAPRHPDPQSFVRSAGPHARACGAQPTGVSTFPKGKR